MLQEPLSVGAKNNYGKVGAGFTLIELLVVFSIIIVVMGIVFTNQGTFNKTLVLSTTAYDVALAMRNAATFGLSARSVGTVVNAGYGMHFDISTPGSLILFADTYPGPSCTTPDCNAGDGSYTAGSDVAVRTYKLGNGIVISDFCSYRNGWSCTSAHGGAGGGLQSLDIVFARPNPNPIITEHHGGGSTLTASTACVTLSSSFGTNRYIAISPVGQVSVTATSCP